jgi:D-sedoheptulose 7-phosphate isomerase
VITVAERTQRIDRGLREGAALLTAVREQLLDDVVRAAQWAEEALRAGGSIMACGNGGSAADAQHLVAELIGRFERKRRPLPAIALTAETSTLTALVNDFGVDDMFARQVRALGRPNDLLVALSTSGTSANVVSAARAAREHGLRTIALTGRDGGPLAAACDLSLRVPCETTARIQEAHGAILHGLCATIDDAFADA